MKRSAFVAVFVSTNIAFVLLHLHKQSQIIKYSYEKQKIETEKNQLTKQKQELTHMLHTMHDRASVKYFAQNVLSKKLEPIKISQIKKIEEL
jgi:hypothetical protein